MLEMEALQGRRLVYKSIYVQKKSTEMALPVPTKAFLLSSPDMAVLFAPFGCTLPLTVLSAHAEPKFQGCCQK